MRTWLCAAVAVVCACLPNTKELGEVDESSSGVDGSSGGEAASGDETTESGTAPEVCDADEPIGGGAYRCEASQHEHQKEPAACELPELAPCTMEYEASSCNGDADCDAGQTCADLSSADFLQCHCVWQGCVTQADCMEGTSCFCGNGSTGSCVPSNCETDADCPGFLCARSWDACGTHGLYCTTVEDECDATEFPCTYVPEVGHWQPSGAIGCP